MSNKGQLWDAQTPCPIAGRVSMDLICVNITNLDHDPQTLDILSSSQTIDDLAGISGTIGYEILTSLGTRYARHYVSQ